MAFPRRTTGTLLMALMLLTSGLALLLMYRALQVDQSWVSVIPTGRLPVSFTLTPLASRENATEVVLERGRNHTERAEARRSLNKFELQAPPFNDSTAKAFEERTHPTTQPTDPDWKGEIVQQEERSLRSPTTSSTKDHSRAAARDRLSTPNADSVIHKQRTEFFSIVDDPRSASNRSYFLVVLVHSATNGTQRRNVIRSTWASEEATGGVSVAFWFVLGAKGVSAHEEQRLKQEQVSKGDLLMLRNVDNRYESLSERTLHSMHYIYTNYDFVYFLKTDDDMFVDMPVLLDEMEHSRPRRRLYWGAFSCHNPPQTEGRWLETRWHSCDVYFPYAYGGLYVLTRDVVGLVARNAPSLQLYCCEDVSLGSWLAGYNLHRVSDVRIFIAHKTKCSRGLIAIHITHRLGSKLVSKFYNNVKRRGHPCTRLQKMEILSWELMPGQCWEPDVYLV